VESLATGFADLADLVVVPSESIRRFLKRHGVEAPCSVVPTGIDVRRFAQGDGEAARRQFRIPSGAFVVGHVGRLSKEKNLTFLAAALGEFLRRQPKAYALIVGSGPEKELCATRLQAAGGGDRCRMPGVLDGDDLVNAYHAMDVFAFASLSETQGIVVAEAMAAGLPVNALHAPGVREVVTDHENGRLIRRRNLDEYVAALEWMVHRTPRQFRELQEAALNSALQLTPERCTDRLERAYRRASRGFVTQDIHGPLTQLIRRLETEWDLLRNLGHAGSEAMDFDR
jgi:glycosyltransferase involved in cell wall biosynthesis